MLLYHHPFLSDCSSEAARRPRGAKLARVLAVTLLLPSLLAGCSSLFDSTNSDTQAGNQNQQAPLLRCGLELLDGDDCDDGDPCTEQDVCVLGTCAGIAKSCADSDVCTTDLCDPETGACNHVRSGERLSVFIQGSQGTMSSPRSITRGPDGDLYVTSGGTHRLARYDAVTGALKNGWDFDNRIPWYVTFGNDGFAYVSETLNDSVRRFDVATGAVVDVVASDMALGRPAGLAFGPDGMLYVCDQFNGLVHRVNPLTNSVEGTLATVDSATDIAFDSDGNAYVASLEQNQVVKIDAGGNLVGPVLPIGDETLSMPRALRFGPEGLLYVLHLPARIERYDLNRNEHVDTLVNESGTAWGFDFGADNTLFLPNRNTSQIFRMAPPAQGCDDGIPCTGDEICTTTGCRALSGQSSLCVASEACRTGTCDLVVGCTFAEAADGTPCSDDKVCTDNDTCQSGACVAGPNRVCPAESDPCLVPTCLEPVGCVTNMVATPACGADCANHRPDVTTQRTTMLMDDLTDAGISGQAVYGITFDGSANATAYIATGAGVFRRDLSQAQSTWAAVPVTGSVGAPVVLLHHNGRLYVGYDDTTGAELHVLDAMGNTVAAFETGSQITALAAGSATGTVFAGTRGGGLWRSTTNGDAWVQVGSSGGSHIADVIAVDTNQVIVATATPNQFLESTDGGASFVNQSAQSGPSDWPAGMALWPGGPHALLVATALSGGGSSNDASGIHGCTVPCRAMTQLGNSGSLQGSVPDAPTSPATDDPLRMNVVVAGPQEIVWVSTTNELWFSSDNGITFVYVANMWNCGTGTIYAMRLHDEHLYLATSAGPLRMDVSMFDAN